MQRSFRTRTIVCLIPTVLSTILVARAYLQDPEGLSGFKRGIDLSGGIVLTYEVDQQLSKANKGDDNPTGERATADAALAEALKKRIDPTDTLGVVIRTRGGNRIEIILPYGTDVQDVRDKVSNVGKLEFRILANTDDDEPAFRDATAYMERAAANPESDEAKALIDARERGQPPPFPNKPADSADEYIVMNEPVQYAWVELGMNVRAEHGLSIAHPEMVRPDSNMAPFFQQARESRNRTLNYGRSLYWSRTTREVEVEVKTEDGVVVERKKVPNDKKKFDYYVLTRVSPKDRLLVGGEITITAFVDQDEKGSPSIGFSFNNSRGSSRFYEMTNRNKPTGDPENPQISRQLAIILDGHLISSANLKSAIRDRGQITGSFDRVYVGRIVSLVRSGALPVTLKDKPLEKKIPATLGRDTVRDGTRSIALAFIAVLAFMVIYYRFAGLVATVALLANLVITIAFMLLVNATFTLPGMAGLVLMLGMAVDANVLIYERVREERDRGMNLQTALRNGYDRAFPVIIDTHLSSIFTAIVLYVVGNDLLKGFGISLAVGLVISLFTSLYMTRLIFDFWQAKNWLTKLRMLRFFSRPNINFMRIRYAMFATTAILTVLGLGLFLARGKQGLDIDFVGGTMYSGRLTEPLDISQLRDIVSKENQDARMNVAEVTEVTDPSGRNRNTYEITYADGKKAIVALAEPPEGLRPEDRAADVKARASFLGEISPEQTFERDDQGEKSSSFTIRTTEREREIVEVSINRLFRDDAGNELLAKNAIAEVKPDGPDFILTFKDPVSISTIKTLFERQFQVSLGDRYTASDVFEIVEVPGSPAVKNLFTTLKLRVLRDTNEGIRNLIAAKELDQVIESARAEFAARPQPDELDSVDGTMASESRNAAFYAILASWLAILLYLWFRSGNWTFGVAAVLCLIHDLCFTLGAIAVCHFVYDTAIGKALSLQDFKINFVAVAALLTLVGYSVNEIMVNFARIREIRGKSQGLTSDLINNSVNQTLSRTILTSATVFLVSFVLYAFGGKGLHLFAFVMMMGVLISTYSSIYIASPLLLMLGEGRVRGVTPPPT